MWWDALKRILIAAMAVCGLAGGTARAAAQPPQRAWELVSPSEKGGNDAIAETSRTHAAASTAPGLPAAVAFASLGGFADAVGGGIATEYLAQRTAQPGTSGWTTHAITPQQQPMSIFAITKQLDPAYEAFAPDLSRAIFRAWSPVTDAPNVAEVESLYTREDLRTPGAGAYRLLTSAPAPLPPITAGDQRPFLAAATGDLAHVLLESRLPLTPDATGASPKLYKADGDALRLLAPAGGCPTPATPCSAAGLGAIALHQTGDTLSADGSRVVLTSPVSATGNVTAAPDPSRLYQLDDRGTTATSDDALVQVDASELATPDEPQLASFQAASADGSRVYFTSAERLTEAAGADGGLYLWERQPASTTQRLAVDATGGAFTLRAQLPAAGAGPETTGPLPHDASAAQVQAALAGLATVGEGNVAVSGGPGAGGPYEIAFGGGLAGVDVPPLLADGSGLSGGAASATVTTAHAVRNLTLVAPGGTDVLAIGASRDGSRVYFVTPAQLVPGGPPVAEYAAYLWQEDPGGGGGTTSFVGGLSFGDALSNANTTPWNQRARTSRVTPDGRTLLLEASDENGLGAGNDHGACTSNPNGTTTGICSQLYLYRAGASTPLAPAIACISCRPSGAPTDANALVNVRSGAGGSQGTSHLSHALSDDGRSAFFSTAAPLVPADANGKADAYEYDVPSGTVRLLSSGQDPADSFFLDASANGDDAYFATRERLVGWDVDRAYDVYDARAGGGFPEPAAVAPGCSGDACRGEAHAAPPLASLGSATLVGRPAAARRRRARACRRGLVRRRVHGRVRCVRRRAAAGHARRGRRGR